MKKILPLIVFALIFLAQVNVGQAAGFLIYEHGTAAMAMAGAFVSLANDASAVFHNPAGIAFLEGTQVQLGASLIFPQSTLDLPNWPVQAQRRWEQENQVFYPPHFYLTQSLGDRVTLGFGFFNPYGLGAKWPMDNPLRFLGYEDDLKTFFFNPTIAFKLSENVSAGFGVSYVYSQVGFHLIELVDLSGYDPRLQLPYEVPASLEGNGSAWSFNAGLLFRGEKFSLGFNWRGGFTIDYEGDLSLDTSGLPPPFNQLLPDTAGGTTAFNFPHILGVGVSYKFSEKFLLTFDVQYVLWSTYERILVEFDDPAFEELDIEQNFEDWFTFRGGFQYMISPAFALRGGIIIDETPQPVESMDPLLPDADRTAFTVGIGYNFGKFVLDVAYQYEPFKDRTSPNRSIYEIPILGINYGEGPYSTTAHIFAITLGFKF